MCSGLINKHEAKRNQIHTGMLFVNDIYYKIFSCVLTVWNKPAVKKPFEYGSKTFSSSELTVN
jgi:hypothetical protein